MEVYKAKHPPVPLRVIRTPSCGRPFWWRFAAARRSRPHEAAAIEIIDDGGLRDPTVNAIEVCCAPVCVTPCRSRGSSLLYYYYVYSSAG